MHYTELLEAKPGSVPATEWNTYRRQVGRWLAEGQAGRYVLIKGEEIIGIYHMDAAAGETGYKRYLGQPFLVHLICVEEPYWRIRGINLPWLPSPNGATRTNFPSSLSLGPHRSPAPVMQAAA